MVSGAILEGTGGSLRLSIDRRWCRCDLIVNENESICLGSEGTEYLVSHLIARLEDLSTDIVGELAGTRVKWILSLADGESVLYAARENAHTVLLWQNADAKLIATLRLLDAQGRVWRKQLHALLDHTTEHVRNSGGDGT